MSLLTLLRRRGGFSPRQLSGLRFWFDPTQLPVVADGTAVATDTDFSGAGKHGTATSGKEPLYKTGILNGRPMLLFDGTDDFISVPAIDLSATSALTFFAVVWCTVPSVAVVYEYSSNFNSFTDSFEMDVDATAAYTLNQKGTAGVANFKTTRTYSNVPIILMGTIDRSLATNETTLYDAGTALGTRSVNQNNATVFGNRTSFFGARNGASAFFKGYMGDRLLYDRLLTKTEQAHVLQYLGQKWALAPRDGILIFDGDSNMLGTSNNPGPNPVPNQVIAALTGKYGWLNLGADGATVADRTAAAAAQVDIYTGVPRRFLVNWMGTNSIAEVPGNLDGATTYAQMQTYFAARIAAGWQRDTIITIDCLPRSNGTPGASYETRRAALNALIAAGAGVDFGAAARISTDGRIGDAGDNNDETYYSSDHGHLINAGYSIVRDVLLPLLAARGVA